MASTLESCYSCQHVCFQCILMNGTRTQNWELMFLMSFSMIGTTSWQGGSHFRNMITNTRLHQQDLVQLNSKSSDHLQPPWIAQAGYTRAVPKGYWTLLLQAPFSPILSFHKNPESCLIPAPGLRNGIFISRLTLLLSQCLVSEHSRRSALFPTVFGRFPPVLVKPSKHRS